MGKKRATDIKNNRRVFISKPRSAREEGQFNARGEVWRTTIAKFVNENCHKNGAPKDSNLTASEARGLKSLRKRVNDGEIHISVSDKGKRFVVCTMESYTRQGLVHIGDDKEVTFPQVKAAQARLTSCARAIAKIFGLGEEGVRRMPRGPGSMLMGVPAVCQ